MNFLPGWNPAGLMAGNVATGVGQAALRLSNSTVAENAPVGWTVGVFSVTNATGAPVYTLVNDAGGMFSVAGDQLQTAGTLDYAMATSYSVTVNVTGTTPTIADKVFQITVTDVTETADVVLSNNTIEENAPAGTVIGTFSVLNATGTPVFTLVDDADGLFEIVGSDLRNTVPFDFEAPAS